MSHDGRRISADEHYGRVPHTGELIGPYDTVDELRAELIESHSEALRDIPDDYRGKCPACGGSGILSADEAAALTMSTDGARTAESGYCPVCEASGELPPFGEGTEGDSPAL